MNIILLTTALILAHWEYPVDCCNNQQHCHPVECSEIGTKGDTYTWHAMTWLKSRARVSPDGGCHVCHSGDVPYCIFIGGMS